MTRRRAPNVKDSLGQIKDSLGQIKDSLGQIKDGNAWKGVE